MYNLFPCHEIRIHLGRTHVLPVEIPEYMRIHNLFGVTCLEYSECQSGNRVAVLLSVREQCCCQSGNMTAVLLSVREYDSSVAVSQEGVLQCCCQSGNMIAVLLSVREYDSSVAVRKGYCSVAVSQGI